MSTPIELNDIPADTHDTIDTGADILPGIEAIDDVAIENIMGGGELSSFFN